MFVPARGNHMDKAYIKLGSILGGEAEEGEANQDVEMQAPSTSKGGRPALGVSRSVSPVKRAKRGLEGAKSVSVRTSECDEISAMRDVSNKLRKFLFTESNRVSKSVSEFTLKCVSDLEEQMIRMIAKNERLLGRLDECEKQMREREARVNETFASVAGKTAGVNVSAAKQAVSMKGTARERSYAVVVKPKDDSVKLSSEQVKECVMKNVSADLNIRVKAVRKTRSGGLAIEAASESELKMLSECKKFGELGLKVEPPRKIGPKVVVFDVENEMTNDEFMKELYERNLKRANVSENEFRQRARVVTRTNKKGVNVGNVIVELSVSMHEILLNEGRVYVKWRSCKVRDFVNVLRCHRCFAFGHMMRECSVKERLCERCGESGHLRDKCKSACVCRNCKMRGRKADHSVMSQECPEYVRMIERERARVNDG